MLYIAVLVILYVGLTLIEKDEQKEELEKSKEMDYDVYFH